MQFKISPLERERERERERGNLPFYLAGKNQQHLMVLPPSREGGIVAAAEWRGREKYFSHKKYKGSLVSQLV